jgi:hypothetical protein
VEEVTVFPFPLEGGVDFGYYCRFSNRNEAADLCPVMEDLFMFSGRRSPSETVKFAFGTKRTGPATCLTLESHHRPTCELDLVE